MSHKAHTVCLEIHPDDQEDCHNLHMPENGVCYKGHLICMDTYECILGHTAYGYKRNPHGVREILSDEIHATLKETNIDELRFVLKKISSYLYHKKQEFKMLFTNTNLYIEQLKTKINDLEHEINNFKQSIISLNIAISKLHVGNVMLHNEIKKLKDENKQLNDKLTMSLFENLDLQKKIVDLTHPIPIPSPSMMLISSCPSPQQMTSYARPFTPTIKPSFIILPQARNSPI
jgi:hypothetical protein